MLLLDDKQANKIRLMLGVTLDRLQKLSAEYPSHALFSRLLYDHSQLCQDWDAIPAMPAPADDEARVEDLIEGLQELLPTATVTLTVHPPPRPLG